MNVGAGYAPSSQAAYTLGLLGAKEQTAALHALFQEDRDKDVRHSAFEATSLMPEKRDAEWYTKFLDDKDDRLREFSAEAIGRLPSSALPQGTLAKLTDQRGTEKSARARLALAFALVAHGRNEQLADLMQSLDSTLHRLKRGEDAVSFVEMIYARRYAQRPQRPHAAHTEHQFLANADAMVAAV